jgi:hypothetical protein
MLPRIELNHNASVQTQQLEAATSGLTSRSNILGTNVKDWLEIASPDPSLAYLTRVSHRFTTSRHQLSQSGVYERLHFVSISTFATLNSAGRPAYLCYALIKKELYNPMKCTWYPHPI